MIACLSAILDCFESRGGRGGSGLFRFGVFRGSMGRGVVGGGPGGNLRS